MFPYHTTKFIWIKCKKNLKQLLYCKSLKVSIYFNRLVIRKGLATETLCNKTCPDNGTGRTEEINFPGGIKQDLVELLQNDFDNRLEIYQQISIFIPENTNNVHLKDSKN